MTNEEVLKQVGGNREGLRNIKRRKIAYLEHIIHNENRFLQLIIEGKIENKRRWDGRQCHDFDV